MTSNIMSKHISSTKDYHNCHTVGIGRATPPFLLPWKGYNSGKFSLDNTPWHSDDIKGCTCGGKELVFKFFLLHRRLSYRAYDSAIRLSWPRAWDMYMGSGHKI